ncbi:acyltransferase [Gymnodinialimonas sp. 2305UL16-5]|uniref:acyltransferase family protein n=1 Tax=Gymnodinialimonas mytili TaxID=3126503 RepID=UPI0030976BC0
MVDRCPSDAPRLKNDISPDLSVWLDLLRIGAAFVVVLGHAGNIRFTDGDLFWVRDWTLAPDAVIVFFVISGLVIGRAATRDADWSTYAFNRLTRLLSVILPALILTLVLDAIGRAIDPGAYTSAHYSELPVVEFLLRGTSFSQEWRGVGAPVQLGSNAPLWSLSFEAAYYLLLGVALFMQGWRRIVALVCLAWLFGLGILVLLPAWLFGVFVWHRIRTGQRPRTVRIALLQAILPIAGLIVAKLAGADHELLRMTPEWLVPQRHPMAYNYAREVLWNTAIAIGLCIHLLGMSRVAPRFGSTASRVIRWCAGGSFSIYVMHYPVMHLMDAGLPEGIPAKALLFVALPVVFCLLFAQVFERPLSGFRRWLAGTIGQAK